MRSTTQVQGVCGDRFARVREVFADRFARGEEVGAAFAVFHDDEPVVDLWGGPADLRTGAPWERGTLCPVFSISKSLTATAALLLWDRGVADIEAPVAEWWTGYGSHGKDRTTGKHLMSHQAALPCFDTKLGTADAENLDLLADLLAGQTPLWEPGTAHGYHALTYGWLVGEIVRRHTGKNVGEFLTEQVLRPHGLEVWLGATKEVAVSAAKVGGFPDDGLDEPAREPVIPEHMRPVAERFADPASLVNRAFASPAAMNEPSGFNNPAVLTTGWPAIGGLASACGLAGFFRQLIAGRMVSQATLRRAVTQQAAGTDRVFGVDVALGLGFMLHRPPLFYVPDGGAQSAFGHIGAGGAFALADPRHGLAMAYLLNGTRSGLADFSRGYPLIEAVYEAIGA
jgi:CubicO group peptidase (beta-lactamase class C family)